MLIAGNGENMTPKAFFGTTVIAGALLFYVGYLMFAPIEGELPDGDVARDVSDKVLAGHIAKFCPELAVAGEPEHSTSKVFDGDYDERAHRYSYELTGSDRTVPAFTVVWAQTSRFREISGGEPDLIANVDKGCAPSR